MRLSILLLAIVCLVSPTALYAQTASPASNTLASAATAAETVAEIVKTGKALIKSLDDSQYQKLQYAFTDLEQRDRWSNLPTSTVPRGGIRMGDLSEKQKQAVWNLIKATLSESGFKQVVDNVNGDETLGQNSGGRMNFDSDEFYVSFLGEPSATDPWMWQFGGHHLAINCTIVGENLTLSPTLTGGQPMRYEWEGKPVRQMELEIDTAYKLIASLSEEQLAKAITGNRYVDIVYGPGVKSIKVNPEGIQASSLSTEQQALLTDLIRHRIAILKPVHAEKEMKSIIAGYENTWFSWYGPTEAGSAATYRIQGPKVAMEYSPQRLGGDPTNHIHAMYRDPSNDFGVAFIKQLGDQKKDSRAAGDGAQLLKLIQGKWEITEANIQGTVVEAMKGGVSEITGNKIVVTNGPVTTTSTMTFEHGTVPLRFKSMSSNNQIGLAIMELNGNEMTVCTSIDPGSGHPKAFEAGPGLILVKFKRKK